MAQGPDNYILSKDLPLECGVNRVLIRSTTKAGTVVLRASAIGLQTAALTLRSKPFKVDNGLALHMPDSGLTAPLDRGPSPPGPSYHLGRTMLPDKK